MLPIIMLALSGCDQLQGVYPLYRSSVTAEGMRIHVATFDAADGDEYNPGKLFHRTRAIREATRRVASRVPASRRYARTLRQFL
jgi:hypothetical protein